MAEQRQQAVSDALEAELLRWLVRLQGSTLVVIGLRFPDEARSDFPAETIAGGYDAMAATWSLVCRGLAVLEFSYSSSEHWRVVPTEAGKLTAAAAGLHWCDTTAGKRRHQHR